MARKKKTSAAKQSASGKQASRSPKPSPASSAAALPKEQLEARLVAQAQARQRYFETLGEVEPDVWMPLVNPDFVRGPQWPGLREGFRRIRRDSHTIVVSDGLSNP